VDIYNLVNAKFLERAQLVYYLTPLIRLTTYVNITCCTFFFSNSVHYSLVDMD